MRFLLIGLCVAVHCLAQSPGNQIYTLSAISGDSGLLNKNILLDPPFTLTRGATKYLHLGINIPPAPPLTVRMVDTFSGAATVVGMAYTLDLVAGANVILAATQTAPGVLRLQISDPGHCETDPGTGAVKSCSGAFVPGPGLRLTEDNPRQLTVDPAYVMARVPLPEVILPGPCAIAAAAWGADERGMFYCIPNHDAWTQGAAPFVWAQPHRYSVPDPSNPGQWIWAASLR